MKTKPLIFNIYAAFFLAIALSVPIQIALLYGHSITDYSVIFNKMTIFNLLVVATCLYNFYYCFSASDNVKWSLPLSIGVICLNNSIVLIYGNDFESMTVILSTILFLSVTSFFLLTHDTDVMNHPENQWWRIAQRQFVNEKIIARIRNDERDLGLTFDLSIGGAFVPLSLEEQHTLLKSGETIEIWLGENKQIKCQAKVVRKVSARGHYPEGIGLQFIDLSIMDRVKLKHLLISDQLSVAA